MISFAPAGAGVGLLFSVYPRFAPWAKVCRRYAAYAERLFLVMVQAKCGIFHGFTIAYIADNATDAPVEADYRLLASEALYVAAAAGFV